MLEIVADTAPLNYLVLIEAVGILARLFASVLIPPAVKKELSHGNAPAAASTWIANPPSWLKVVSLIVRRLWPQCSPIWTAARQKQSRSRWNSPERSS